jgi:hypothetical protein
LHLLGFISGRGNLIKIDSNCEVLQPLKVITTNLTLSKSNENMKSTSDAEAPDVQGWIPKHWLTAIVSISRFEIRFPNIPHRLAGKNKRSKNENSQ